MEDKERDAFVRTSHFARAALVLLGCVAFASSGCARLESKPAELTTRSLTTDEEAAVRQVALRSPLAALALLRMFEKRDPGDGVLYLDHFPSIDEVLRHDGADRVLALEGAIRRNPYGSTPLNIRIRWWVDHRNAGSMLLVFSSELVSATGEALEPRHPLERDAFVELTARGVRVVHGAAAPTETAEIPQGKQWIAQLSARNPDG